jgi:predicted enzyme related to lactoylglutathione lyase
MVGDPAAFVWYELLTTDLPAAQAFYGRVVGWTVEDASTPQFGYRLFSTDGAPVAGLMELPLEGRKKGAMPRWVGYVAVQDVDASIDRLKALGGTVYVPPTDSNIGRIAVVADPQTATLALVSRLTYSSAPTSEEGECGRVGWHELLAGEGKAAFGFYSALFGWEKAQGEAALVDSYALFAAGGRTLGGMFTKFAAAPVPFWLYYFDVADLDVAIGEVKAGGGRVAQGPIELWGGSWAARCIDPQGAMFALQGRRDPAAIVRGGEGHGDAALAFSASWGGISSRGQLLGKKPGEKAKKPKR